VSIYLERVYTTPRKETVMTPREAIQILMLSPIYFQLQPAERRQLIKEYCELFSQVAAEQAYNSADK